MAQADIWASLLLAYSTPRHMLSTVGWVPRALFARGAGPLLLLFSQPPSPQTGFLIFKPAWVVERVCIIQRGPKREREREGPFPLWRRERRGGGSWEKF